MDCGIQHVVSLCIFRLSYKIVKTLPCKMPAVFEVFSIGYACDNLQTSAHYCTVSSTVETNGRLYLLLSAKDVLHPFAQKARIDCTKYTRFSETGSAKGAEINVSIPT